MAKTHDPCQVPKGLNSTFDGTVTDLRLFNESLLQRTLQCGMPQPFRRLLLVTHDTLVKLQTYLRSLAISVGLLAVVTPEMRLVRIIKMAFRAKAELMEYSHTEFNLQGMQLLCYILPYPPVIDFECKASKCQVSGMYPKLISHLGQLFNFTVAYNLDPSGKWGDLDKLDDDERSVLKSLHKGHSAFSFSWIGTYDRL